MVLTYFKGLPCLHIQQETLYSYMASWNDGIGNSIRSVPARAPHRLWPEVPQFCNENKFDQLLIVFSSSNAAFKL